MAEAIIVIGMGYGDEGKGSITDFLVRRHNAKTVVRYNGGSQAAHTVVAPSGQTHTFAQFGSGTLVPGVRTHLSQYMKVDPLNMLVEESALQNIGVHDAFTRTTIDENALIITPFHKLANRLRERSRGNGRHGSCGLGVGETQADFEAGYFITAGHLDKPLLLRARLRDIQLYKRRQLLEQGILLPGRPCFELDAASVIEALAHDYTNFISSGISIVNGDFLTAALDDTVVFEGAQGVLLDQDVGFHPHTTWSSTTTTNAESLLEQAGYNNSVTRLGVLRAYMTRHGHGPFVTEDKALTETLPDSHNYFSEWQHGFRVGWPDLVMARYAVEANRGVDALAVTSLDRWHALGEGHHQICTTYDLGPGNKTVAAIRTPRTLEEQAALTQLLFTARPRYSPAGDDYLNVLSAVLRFIPITIKSYGPSAADKIEDA